MTYKTKTSLASLIYEILMSDDNSDMQIVGSDIATAMKSYGVKYVSILQLMDNLDDEMYKASPFDTAEDWFLDVVNTNRFSVEFIEDRMGECMV